MGNAPNRMTAAARLHLWRCKAIFSLSSPASSCDCLQCRGVPQGTRPAAWVRVPAKQVVLHGFLATPVPWVCFKAATRQGFMSC